MQQLKYRRITFHRVEIPAVFVPSSNIFMSELKVLNLKHIYVYQNLG